MYHREKIRQRDGRQTVVKGWEERSFNFKYSCERWYMSKHLKEVRKRVWIYLKSILSSRNSRGNDSEMYLLGSKTANWLVWLKPSKQAINKRWAQKDNLAPEHVQSSQITVNIWFSLWAKWEVHEKFEVEDWRDPACPLKGLIWLLNWWQEEQEY